MLLGGFDSSSSGGALHWPLQGLPTGKEEHPAAACLEGDGAVVKAGHHGEALDRSHVPDHIGDDLGSLQLLLQPAGKGSVRVGLDGWGGVEVQQGVGIPCKRVLDDSVMQSALQSALHTQSCRWCPERHASNWLRAACTRAEHGRAHKAACTRIGMQLGTQSCLHAARAALTGAHRSNPGRQ